MADDDADDRFLVKEAFQEIGENHQINFVENGEQLMDYLEKRNTFTPENAPPPDLVLLDINMPKKNGIEVLREIRENRKLSSIPIVVLSTSNSEEDILRSYELGANSFITKPIGFDQLVESLKNLNTYWFETVSLPKKYDR